MTLLFPSLASDSPEDWLIKERLPFPSVPRIWSCIPSEVGIVNCGPPPAGGTKRPPIRGSCVALSNSILSLSRSSKRKSFFAKVEVSKRTSTSLRTAGFSKWSPVASSNKIWSPTSTAGPSRTRLSPASVPELSVPFRRTTSPKSPSSARVSDLSGNVIVRSAVGFVIDRVVSKSSATDPSKTRVELNDNPETSVLRLLNC